MKLSIMLLLLTVPFMNLFAQDFPAYKLYNNRGVEIPFGNVSEQAANSDIVFFGELHNNPISHWLQYELTASLYDAKKENLMLGAEMFESDDQLKINEYFADMISQKSFEKECRLWNNYKTDYKPVFEFAKENGLKYIATNIPRRYASLVAKRGFKALDSLSDGAKEFIAPLPIEVDLNLKSYKSMESMGMMHKTGKKPSMKAMKSKMDSLSNEEKQAQMKKMMAAMSKMQYFKQAQASKDATMAHFILKNFKSGGTFLHLNGAYHSNDYEGIVWFIKKQKPEYKILTITTIEKDKFDELNDEEKKMADIIIVVKSSLTKSY